jgi:hypothetical protein
MEVSIAHLSPRGWVSDIEHLLGRLQAYRRAGLERLGRLALLWRFAYRGGGGFGSWLPRFCNDVARRP